MTSETERGGDVRVTIEQAIEFVQTACRNWDCDPVLTDADFQDVADELRRFVRDRIPLTTHPPAGDGVERGCEWCVDGLQADGRNALPMPRSCEGADVDQLKRERDNYENLYHFWNRKARDVAQENAALKAERESLIATKHEQIDRLRRDRITAERDTLSMAGKLNKAEARAERAEAALAEANAEIERMTPKFVAYEYLESPAGREIAEDALRQISALSYAEADKAIDIADATLNATREAGDQKPYLTDFELRILRSMDGGPEVTWGASVSAALEYLSEAGLCTRGPSYQITDKGRGESRVSWRA